MHGRGGPLDVRLANASVAEPNVLGDRAREQIHILKHEAEQATQLPKLHFTDVHPVDQDPSSIDVVEPQEQADQGRLASAGGADDADPLTRHHVERDVAEHVLLAPVGRPDVVEDDPSGRLGRARRRRCWALDLDRGVEQAEDSFRRGHRGLQQVELLGQVADRPEEPLGV